MTDFPTGLPDIPNASAAQPLATMHGTESHVTSMNRAIANILALATKLGYGSSSPGASAAVLRRTATGQSGWGAVQQVDIVGGGTANRLLRTPDGTAVGWGQVVTADISALAVGTNELQANAVSQVSMATGSTSDPTTTSGSAADVPQMSVTLTTTGGPVLLWFTGVFSNGTAGNTMVLYAVLDGSTVQQREWTFPSANQQVIAPHAHLFTGVSVASHTFKMQWLTTGGTLKGHGTYRSLIALELKK